MDRTYLAYQSGEQERTGADKQRQTRENSVKKSGG